MRLSIAKSIEEELIIRLADSAKDVAVKGVKVLNKAQVFGTTENLSLIFCVKRVIMS